MECVPPVGVEDCDSLTRPRDECLEMPSTMSFRYSGGDCSESSNLQLLSTFPCVDFNGGPPSLGNASAFIVITDGFEEVFVYHAAFVAPGEEVTIENFFLPAFGVDLLKITIYASDMISSENILQSIRLRISCSQDAYLLDQYGSMQLISYANNVQGLVDSIVEATMVYTIVGETVILKSLNDITSLANDGIWNMTNEVVGSVLESPSENIVVERPFSLDLSKRELYTFFSIVQGSTTDGFSCRDSNFFSFTAATNFIV
jgi:hypothetical protein